MSAETVCKFFKFGYCKFGLTCFKQHEKENCEKFSCDIEKCSLRHPRKFKFYMEYRRCKFGEYCSYSHVNDIESSDLKDDFKAWKK